jgi:anti-sigma regulatory factor (Ser/Thr protein kinase)
MENRGVTVKTKLARQLTATPVDATQLQQVLVNLVKNAAQAMTTGGTLTLQTGETGDGVWVSVTDTGGGIPQEQINRIFEPFYTTKKKGTGLGLMIVQRIVRAHNGRIELESNVGRGTTFRIWLPLHERKPRLLEQKTGKGTTDGGENTDVKLRISAWLERPSAAFTNGQHKAPEDWRIQDADAFNPCCIRVHPRLKIHETDIADCG